MKPNTLPQTGRTTYKSMMLISFLVVAFMLIPFSSALDWDNVKKEVIIQKDSSILIGEKELIYNQIWETYKPIKINNIFGFGETLFEGAITKHTEVCSNDCESEMEIYLANDGVLIDDVIFKTLKGESWEEQNIRNYQFYINTKGKKIIMPDYELQCNDLGIYKNGTKIKDCKNVLVGTHIEDAPEWTPYHIKDELPKGIYEVKLEAEKKPSRTVDWIIKTNGKWLESWATWGNISLGDDAEVNLISPINFFNITSNLVLFNATANITGGARIQNMSLWTNETGSWAFYNVTASIPFVENSTAEESGAMGIQEASLNDYTMNLYAEANGIITGVALGTATGGTLISNVSIIQNGVVLAWKLSDIYQFDNATKVLFTSSDYSDYIKPSVNGGLFSVRIKKYFGTSDQGYTLGTYTFNGDLFNYTAQQGMARHVSMPAETLFFYNTTISPSFFNLTVNRTITEDIIWNTQACDSDGDCGFATTNRTLNIDKGLPTITITTPSGNIGVPENNGNFTLNFTSTDTNLDSCWYEYNGTNTTIEGCLTGISNSTNIILANQRNITVYTNDTVGNLNSSTKSFDWNIRLNMLNSKGTLISQSKWIINGTTYTSNPLERGSNIFLNNLTNNTLRVIAEDLQGYSSTINTTTNFMTNQTEYNYTLTPKSLDINFYYENGTEYTIKGYWITSNGSNGYFEDNNLTIPILNLPEGRTMIKFGYNLTDYSNYTQFYEFENEWGTEVEENITVLDNMETNGFIKTLEDVTGDTIDNVKLRAYSITANSTDSKKFIGQLYSGGQIGSGLVYFFIPKNKESWINWEKTGYELGEESVDFNLKEYTQTDPYVIKLERGITGIYQNLMATTCGWYNGNTTTIPLSIFAPEGGNIEFNTSYYPTQQIIILNNNNRANINLTHGTEFTNTELTNFSIYIYEDDELKITLTIPYVSTTDSKFNEPEGLDNTTKIRLLWIGLIFSVGILGLILKKGEDGIGDGGNGKIFFFIGVFVISIISGGAFSWLLWVTGFYFLLMAINKLIKE